MNSKGLTHTGTATFIISYCTIVSYDCRLDSRICLQILSVFDKPKTYTVEAETFVEDFSLLFSLAE